jgi:hypothetical protein
VGDETRPAPEHPIGGTPAEGDAAVAGAAAMTVALNAPAGASFLADDADVRLT